MITNLELQDHQVRRLVQDDSRKLKFLSLAVGSWEVIVLNVS